MTNNRITRFLRWPLVPVASIVAAAIGGSVMTGIQDFATGFMDGYSETHWLHIYVYPIVPMGVFGFMLAGTAVHIAPRAKLKAGAVMTAIMGAALIAFTTVCFVMQVPGREAIQVLVGSLAAIAAAVLALRQARTESDELSE